jgi:hypothetical protein
MTERKLFLESYVGDVAIVTAKYRTHYETEVMGGELDGWLLKAKDKAGAERNHKGIEDLLNQRQGKPTSTLNFAATGLSLRREGLLA